MFNPRPSSGISHSFSKASAKIDVPARIETQVSSSTDQSANLSLHDGIFGRFGILKDDNLAVSPSFDSKNFDDSHIFNDVKRSSSSGRYNALDFDIQPMADVSTIEMPKSAVELSTEGIFDKNYLVQLILTFERLSKFNKKLISEPLRFRFIDISHHGYDKEAENEGLIDKNGNKIKKIIYAKQADGHYRRSYLDRGMKGAGHSYYDSNNSSAVPKQAYPMRVIHNDSDILDTVRHEASTLEHPNINGLDVYETRRGATQTDWKSGDIRGKVDIEFKRSDLADKNRDPLLAFKEGTDEYPFAKPKLRPIPSQTDWKSKNSFENDIGFFQFSKRGFPQKEETKDSEQSFLEKLLDKPFDNEDDTFTQNVNSPRRSIWGDNEQTVNLQWQYMDPHGIVHGPFPSEQMYQWYSKNFFPQNLRMRYNTKMSWTPLKDLYPPNTSAFRSLPSGYDGKGDSWPTAAPQWKTPRDSVSSFNDREVLRSQQSPFFGKMHEIPKVSHDLPKVVAAKTHTSAALPIDILGSLEPKPKPSLHASPFLSMEKPITKRTPNKTPEGRDTLHRGAAGILKNLEVLSAKEVTTHSMPQTQEHVSDPPRESLGWKKTEVEVASLLEIMEIQKKQSVAEAKEEPAKKVMQTGWDFSNNNAHVDLSEDFPTLGTDVRVVTTRTTKSTFSKQITTMPLETFIERNSGVVSGLESNQTFASKVFGK
ncbi:hypothetical protein BEWA_019020 [Theileria equi strain WA]|uniref:GYF domain-containing protein n=1 Tax=Theileria equi strain WA TaxID=1537102 RepID=L0ATT3_THEEQ|nr:hypothetical protein BEWA_019020 [Theileria equi strain WA]AFZ79057.1 hypothetical protein BEWA_019020 [Theileria equi strain WA]|eukprot:XP_004828723.1 hypothetical protein BEWA_019020 [Theileria equi strain WA]